MQTNFFETLLTMSPQSTWSIVIKPSAGGRYVVGVMMDNARIKNEAADSLIPKNITGTITDLDENFFTALIEQVKKTDDFFTNQIQYEESLELAKKQAKPTVNTNDKDYREKIQRQRKVDEVLKRVNELQAQEKYGEAIGQLQTLELKNFPEHTDQLTAKLTELKELRSKGELF